MLLEQRAPAVLIDLLCLLGWNIVAVFVIKPSKAIIAVFIEAVSIGVEEAPVLEQEKAICIVVALESFDFFLIHAHELSLFFWICNFSCRFYHSLKTETIINFKSKLIYKNNDANQSANITSMSLWHKCFHETGAIHDQPINIATYKQRICMASKADTPKALEHSNRGHG